MVIQTENNSEISDVRAIPHKIVNKFLKLFFNSLENCSLTNLDGVNTAIIIMKEGENTFRNKLNMKMYKDYNNFIRSEFNKDPKYYNRTIVYESEIKENKMFIRWS